MIVRRALLRSVVVAVALCSMPLAAPRDVRAEADGAGALVLERDAWKDPAVHDAWLAMDPRTPRGLEARRRLLSADEAYRRALAAWRDDRGQQATEAFAEGARTAPIDPELFVDVAARYEEQGDWARAEAFYASYVAARPGGARSEEARRGLSRVVVGRAAARTGDPLPRTESETERERAPLVVPTASPERTRSSAATASVRFTSRELVFLVVSVAALLVALGLVLRIVFDRRLSLEELAELHPELHASIAYLVGALRHELLKHRLGGFSASPGLASASEDSRERRAFLRARLYGGKALSEAWSEHRDAFERELGPSFGFTRDPVLRRAARALHRIERLREREDAAADARLLDALSELAALDRHLSGLVRTLARTRLDRALLEGVVDDVRREPSAGAVELAEIVVEAPAEPVEVEVYLRDLRLVLRNLVRNAILALGSSPAPRRFALRAHVELLPSGEELACIVVLDSAAGSFDPERLGRSSVDRGLGLVRVTLSRYGGTLDVEPGRDGYAKAVVVRFFRTYDDEPSTASGILVP